MTSDYAAAYFMAEEKTIKMAEELIISGSAQVGLEELGNYLGCFLRSVADLHGDFLPTDEPMAELVDQFVMNTTYVQEKDSPYAPWIALPDEARGADILQRYIVIRAQCGLNS